jgi:DNA polymerase sigma
MAACATVCIVDSSTGSDMYSTGSDVDCVVVGVGARQTERACMCACESHVRDSPCFHDNEFVECVLSRLCSVCV